MGDLLPFAYPKTLKASFPEMFKEMSMATVLVRLRRVHKKNKSMVLLKFDLHRTWPNRHIWALISRPDRGRPT
jgi:hypothetical protein